MKVIAIDRGVAKQTGLAGVNDLLAPDRLDLLLEQSDVLVIAAPLTPETLPHDWRRAARADEARRGPDQRRPRAESSITRP